MSHNIACFRCGASLASLSLPLSRRDECPECAAHLHVCRMCRNFDPAAVRQCLEDDAEEVADKERVNFCEWFAPTEGAFDPAAKAEADRARQSLDALFGDGDAAAESADSALSEAEKLFRS
ncbi:MAG TPA: hypothetical protein VK854_10460 [Woeseiaceae bacterium]|nr:hypothetical protein [Woeseiaceae bacterium]